MTNTQKTQN